MSDDKSQRGSPDNKRIDIHDPYEIRHWSQSLGAGRGIAAGEGVEHSGADAVQS
jgi:hypothetical protein